MDPPNEGNTARYCSDASWLCLDCTNTGYAGVTYNTYCDACTDDCPAVDMTRDAGCHASLANAAPQNIFGDSVCTSCPNGETCYECDDEWHWDDSEKECMRDCQYDTCEDQAKCHSEFLCELEGDGLTDNNGCWWDGSNCCYDGKVWDPIREECKEFDACFSEPQSRCDYSPFSTSWWNYALYPDCLDPSEGCCEVIQYGGLTYDYINHNDI